MSLEKSFQEWYGHALDSVEERDGQLLLMLKECNSTQRFNVLQYHYREAEKAVGAIESCIIQLRLHQALSSEDPHLHFYQRNLILALQAQRYVHVMDLYREGLFLDQLGPKLVEQDS